MKTLQLNDNQVALIDDEDFEALSRFHWFASDGYVMRSNYKDGDQYPCVRMHNQIMRPPAGMIVDHINGDTLDNRRANLRICTFAQNLCNKKLDKRNKTGYKGVYAEPSGSLHPFRAMIGYHGKLHYVGLYATAEEAARAYNDAARDLHGDFARLNEI